MFNQILCMKNQIITIALIISIILSSCTLALTKRYHLTEDDILNYIEVYTNLREQSPEILERINKDPKNSDIGKEEYNKIRDIIIDGGFESFADFVYINSKIGTVFSLIQAQKGMETFENLHEDSADAIQKSIEELQKIIDDPSTPDDTKMELQKQILELQKNQQTLNNDWTNNKKWADLVLKSTKKISGLIVSKEDIELVEKYESEIMEAYTGFQVPELPDGSFPEIDLENYN